MQRLAEATRAATAAALDATGGGLAILFASPAGADAPQSETQLRSAAGFTSAQAARDAAESLMPRVRETLETRQAGAFAAEPALGECASGGIVMHPLLFEERIYGVLAVASPESIDTPRQQALAQLAEGLALHFDHAYLTTRFQQLEKQIGRTQWGFEQKGEEILKLSEALFAQDIELLRSKERLSQVENLKSDFIERMSRELRTPLNGIIETIISVLTNENEALAENSKESLRCALDDGTGFLRTLQNILDLWRVKQGEMPVELQEINFRDAVDEAIFSVQDAASRKPLEVEQEIVEPFPNIRSDLAKINQLVFLLLENAVKFTPAGKVTIRARAEKDRLYCEVSDTGIGIAQDDQVSVVDHFFQVDEGSSPRYSGAGLGLTLVRELVELLDGELSLSSEIGRGTTVAFELPIQVVG
jgi:signal transduction histidine kinase